MKPEVNLMHNVWSDLVITNRGQTGLPQLNFDEIASSIFSSGPLYFYIIDFFDMSISNISKGMKEAHGIENENIKNINDVLALVHPEDMPFVAKAEEKAFNLIYTKLGVEKITKYKFSYNFRFKTADGTYKLYNHQSLILTVDEKSNFIKSLNIHTDISHITKKNNYKLSLLGLAGEQSYLNMNVMDQPENSTPITECAFSRRELEIVKLISEGLETAEISERLHIALDTVKSHRKNILKKAGCKNSAELVAISMSEGWI